VIEKTQAILCPTGSMGLVYLPMFYHKKSTIPVCMGVELRILSVISFPKLGKSDLFAATFRLKSLKLLWGTICPLRTTETVLQKKAPLRI